MFSRLASYISMNIKMKEFFDILAGVDVVHIGIQDTPEHHLEMVRAATAFFIQFSETFKIQAFYQSVN